MDCGRCEVLITTGRYRIVGEIALYQGTRFTDYLIEANRFIAICEATVSDHDGNILFSTPFMNLNRDAIEMMVPTDGISWKKH